MLQRVSALLSKKRELEKEVVRKDSAIQEKAGDIEALAGDKRRHEEESKNTVERMQLVHSVETDQFKLENEDLKGKFEERETIVIMKDARITELERRCKQLTEKVEQQIRDKNSIIADKDLTIAHKDSTIAHKDSMLASKYTSLQKKEATIQILNDQLTKTRHYLTSKPQVSSSTLYY